LPIAYQLESDNAQRPWINRTQIKRMPFSRIRAHALLLGSLTLTLIENEAVPSY